MIRVVHSSVATEDLPSIWSYIAADNVKAVDRFLYVINQKCALQRARRNHIRRDLLLAEHIRGSAEEIGLASVAIDGARSLDGIVSLVEAHAAPASRQSQHLCNLDRVLAQAPGDVR